MSNMNDDDGISQEIARLKSGLADILEQQKPRLHAEARAVRDKIKVAAMLTSRDACGMARNLHIVLEEICSRARTGQPVKKSDIVAKAGMADADGKSRPLHAYTLPPGLEGETAMKRKLRIARKPGNYLKLVRAAAALAGQDEDMLVIRLVEGTSLAKGLDDLFDDSQADHLDLLTQALRGEARRIVATSGLEWYFSKVDGQCLIETDGGWETSYSDPEFVAALPVVWLWTEERAEFEGVWKPHSTNGNRKDPEARTALICSRVGLTVAPFGRDRSIVPCLFRRWITVLIGPRHEQPQPQGNLAKLHLDLYPRVRLAAPREGFDIIRSRQGVFRVADRTVVSGHIQALDIHDMDEFTEVTPSSLAVAMEVVGPEVDSVEGDVLQCVPEAYTKSPPNTRMSRLEAALVSGCGDSEPSITLGAYLEAGAATSVASLRRWIATQEARIDTALSRMACWGS